MMKILLALLLAFLFMLTSLQADAEVLATMEPRVAIRHLFSEPPSLGRKGNAGANDAKTPISNEGNSNTEAKTGKDASDDDDDDDETNQSLGGYGGGSSTETHHHYINGKQLFGDLIEQLKNGSPLKEWKESSVSCNTIRGGLYSEYLPLLEQAAILGGITGLDVRFKMHETKKVFEHRSCRFLQATGGTVRALDAYVTLSFAGLVVCQGQVAG
ncbi:hypothetical protein SADUNF_Sadunf08G0083100 [Salix dunnii]|uniref:Uncharacterized protein n=1 Tax=Salix dunnii TaxID=1413687 RepID=A0A835JZS7_9ROSI|nr:hypothetical protein SADUNF_Sadunf08G0083100 [Salix dunnii]